jgi:integrase
MSRQTLWGLFESNYQRQNRSCAKTAKQYQVQFTHYGRWLGREPTLDDLNDELLAAFLDHHANGRSAPTANKAYWCIVAIWRRASDLGMVLTRPTVQPLPEPDEIPFAWLVEELQAILRTCGVVPGMIGGVPARLWWLGLHWTIWSTGERIGALMSVKRSALNLQRGELYVSAELRKGRRKPRLYPLLPQAVDILREAQAFDREFLFPWPLCNATLYNRYKKILAASGLPTDRKCKFHRIRRSVASYLEAAGGNATDWLDHSGRRVTRRSYLDPRICGENDAARKLPRLDPPEAA